ncbi:hypothetical protein E3N88_14866 [Mikania micrantha]|uniref:non-specific serine/threonine protein kinase n=1 Tax=Mikania micrantha TaxID=192012 RepID=A0A5N6P586_9ASTR|nr:hypothetical protein E3N88_14866 [Mikania micrantha]
MIAAQQTSGSVSVGASLTATPDARPWLSSSGEFAMGFQQDQDKDFLLSIWFDKIPDKTIICDPQGKEVWSSGSNSDLAYGRLNDTGNFVIVGRNASNIWESFDHPADTMLPTQVMDRGGVINSRMGKLNFKGGKFQLRLQLDGNLFLILEICLQETDGPPEIGKNCSGSGEDKSERSLIIVGSALFELVKATDEFKSELGKGAFGIVYKGVVGTKYVAVKKLESFVQDVHKEFKAEVNTIARTHHKNLVQLLGYCDDGEKRLLLLETKEIYPASVAKGLTYLHEDCCNQIIHCDIKPQNILLDDYYNAKIADFGLAKLLMINQSRTNTGIRGTKGYVAPEWFRNIPVTFKVDVYSFGVLLFEIISCRKSVVFDDDAEDVPVLTDLAWDCYREGRLDMFVKDDLEALDDIEKLTTYMMVGLWCVQETLH